MSVYGRLAALAYAEKYWNKVCHDGFVATKNGYPRYGSGLPIASIAKAADTTCLKTSADEEDCAHFISCCIGITRDAVGVMGGGLPIPSPIGGGIYGHTFAPALFFFLYNNKMVRIVGSQYRRTSLNPNELDPLRRIPDPETVASIRKDLTRGDLLAYASLEPKNPAKPEEGNKETPWAGHYEHFGLLTLDTSIACHTCARFNAPYTDVGWPFVTLLKVTK